MNPRILVETALQNAHKEPDEGGTPSLVHRNRSKHFVEALASRFREYYRDKDTVRVLSRHCDLHREEFGLNELLFDVLVCETSLVQSARESASLRFVTRALWAVESEFARDTRQAIFDFNKLVLSSAEAKLFVGPIVPDENAFLERLLAPASRCSGEVFVALVPHPSDWPPTDASAHVYRLQASEWEALRPSASDAGSQHP